MEEVRYWIATDGEKFDDKEACRIYEEGLRFGELEGTFLCMTLTRKDQSLTIVVLIRLSILSPIAPMLWTL